MNLNYWHDLYQKFKFQSFCLDIEVTEFNGPISVIGLYQPKEGEIEYISLIKEKDLNNETLKECFKGCKLLITFNGLNFDIPKIKQEFPGVIPDVPVIDLYLIAKELNFQASLKTLENTFGIFRRDEVAYQKGIAIKLWNQYKRYNNENALNKLLTYNREDCINLYPLAEELMKLIKKD